MRKEQPLQFEDPSIASFEITEVIDANDNVTIEVILGVFMPDAKVRHILLTKAELLNMLTEIQNCENSPTYLFDNYIAD